MRNRGRALAFFVNTDLHYEVNGSLDGLVNNLPAIEVMLRHGADPRLGAPFLGPPSALRCVVSAQRRGCAPKFFEAVGGCWTRWLRLCKVCVFSLGFGCRSGSFVD